jgi:hypothetical protein
LARLKENGHPITRPDIARILRRENPETYAGEEAAVTLRRVYRISVKLKASAQRR